MKKTKSIFFLSTVFFSFSAPSFAEEAFYVELGSDSTVSEAAKEWKRLSDEYAPILSELKYYPKSVRQARNVVATRIQAGPIDTKEKAQKICSKLFKEDVPCFVIEGYRGTPPASVASISEPLPSPAQGAKFVQLPWLAPGYQSPSASIQEMPIASDTPEDNAAGAKRQAQVQVAEAIRVPLTFQENQPAPVPVVIRTLPNIQHTAYNPEASDSRYPDESDTSGSGWLTVSGFLNDGIASSFWDEVRVAAPKKTKNIRVRYDRPVLTSRRMPSTRTAMHLGVFESSKEAYGFCRETIQASERGLACRFVKAEPGLADVKMASAGNAQNEAYYASQMENRRRPQGNQLAALAPAAGGQGRQFWIQLLKAPSQMAAMKSWEAIKTRHADLLEGMRSNVTSSLTEKNAYFVRVGPVSNHDNAVRTCEKLQDRKVDCRVLMYSSGNR